MSSAHLAHWMTWSIISSGMKAAYADLTNLFATATTSRGYLDPAGACRSCSAISCPIVKAFDAALDNVLPPNIKSISPNSDRWLNIHHVELNGSIWKNNGLDNGCLYGIVWDCEHPQLSKYHPQTHQPTGVALGRWCRSWVDAWWKKPYNTGWGPSSLAKLVCNYNNNSVWYL